MDLVAGQSVRTSADQAHYLRHVMRREVGDHVLLFNGRDGEWHGEITGWNKHGAELRVQEQTRSQAAEPDVWLLFAPLKRAHLDFMIEKTSELGVARLLPVLTRHTVAERVNIVRLQAIAIEAAEQCERLTVPSVETPQGLQTGLAALPADRVLLFCAEAGAVTPMATALHAIQARGGDARKAALLTGPEGGFSAEEMKMIRAVPNAVAVGLGPRILRADTAAISALACWQALCGDWALPVPPRALYAKF